MMWKYLESIISWTLLESLVGPITKLIDHYLAEFKKKINSQIHNFLNLLQIF